METAHAIGRGKLSEKLKSRRIAFGNTVYNASYPWCCPGNGFGQHPLRAGIDHTVQIHHVIQGLHVNQIRGPQRRMLRDQCLYFDTELRVAGASLETAFLVRSTTSHGIGQKAAKGQRKGIARLFHGAQRCIPGIYDAHDGAAASPGISEGQATRCRPLYPRK